MIKKWEIFLSAYNTILLKNVELKVRHKKMYFENNETKQCLIICTLLQKLVKSNKHQITNMSKT